MPIRAINEACFFVLVNFRGTFIDTERLVSKLEKPSKRREIPTRPDSSPNNEACSTRSRLNHSMEIELDNKLVKHKTYKYKTC